MPGTRELLIIAFVRARARAHRRDRPAIRAPRQASAAIPTARSVRSSRFKPAIRCRPVLRQHRRHRRPPQPTAIPCHSRRFGSRSHSKRAMPRVKPQRLRRNRFRVGQLFRPTQTLAIVGDQHIFYGEVAPTVAQILAPIADHIKTETERQELEKVRENLTRQVVRQIVDTKLMYLEFERQIEKSAGRDKLAEVRKTIASRMQADFETDLAEIRKQIAASKPEQVQKMMSRDPVLPRMAVLMKEHNCETLHELDAVLRRYGSSLDKQIRLYGENKAGRSTVSKHVNTKPEVTHQEMLDYYRQNAAEFAVPAKARFEILTVKFANFPTKGRRLEHAGPDGERGVFQHAVCHRGPQPLAGTQRPEGRLLRLDDARQPGLQADRRGRLHARAGKLSQIIEDERGYHIVRVIERADAGEVSFLEAQPGIKKALIAQKLEADYKQYVEMLRTSTRVWTIYDEAALAAATKRCTPALSCFIVRETKSHG